MLQIKHSLQHRFGHRSRCCARRRGRGAAGGSSAAMVECGAFLPALQLALSASSTVWPSASSHQQAFFFSLSRIMTGFASNQDYTAGLDSFNCYLLEKPEHMLVEAAACIHTNAPSRSSHCCPSIPAPGTAQAQHLLKRFSLPSSRLLCLPITCPQLCQKAALALSATPVVGPLSYTAAVAVLHHAYSDYACLPQAVVPDKQHLCNESACLS